MDSCVDSRFLKALNEVNALSERQLDAYPAGSRAILQHHVWAVFDWTTTLGMSSDAPDVPARDLHALQQVLADVIRRLALPRDEILRLPNPLAATIEQGTYPTTFDATAPHQAFLPEDILEDDSPWVCLSKLDHEVPAINHTDAVSGRSAFLILLRLPDGRTATSRYLRELASFRTPWAEGDRESYINIAPHPAMQYLKLHVNPRTPQIPIGSQTALIEQAILISDSGKLVLSPLVTNVQIRTFSHVDVDRRRSTVAAAHGQAFAEFVIEPREWLRGRARLRPISVEEVRHTTTFSADDPFENSRESDLTPRLQTCIACHSSSGIHSFNSRTELFQNRSLVPPRFAPASPATIASQTARIKRREYSWGLLNGLWRKTAN